MWRMETIGHSSLSENKLLFKLNMHLDRKVHALKARKKHDNKQKH